MPRVGTGIRLHPWLYRSLLAVLGGVALSGCLWLFQDVSVLSEGDPAPRWLAQAHGAFALFSLVVVGALLPQHVRFAWAARRNRRVGLPLLVLMGLLGLSGYGLYYGPQDWHGLVMWTHAGVGLAAMLALPAHVFIGWRHRSHRKPTKDGL